MANKVYVNPAETVIDWADSGGDETLTLASLASGAGRQGALHDFGATSRASRYIWRFFCQFNTAPVVGEIVRVYLKSSDGTNPDNDDGTGDAAVSAEDKLNNLQFLGGLLVDEASTSGVMVMSGSVERAERHLAPVIWNATADALHATAANNGFSLQPMPDEIQ